MKFNYELFKELSDEVLYYMPALNDWKNPRAETYQLYDLDTPIGIPIYNTSFPKWRELRVYIFDEIRRLKRKINDLILQTDHTDKELINNITESFMDLARHKYA